MSLYYGQKRYLNQLAFLYKRGDRIALQGKNGTGKTSLLKWILGEKIALREKYKKEVH